MTCLAHRRGLELLEQLAEVHVKQQVTWCSSSKYVVTSPEEELLFHLDDSYVFTFLMNGGRRPFHVRASDTQDTMVFTLHRPYRLFSDKVKVLMDGKVVTVIRKEQTVRPIYSINDASDRPVLRAKGSYSANDFKDGNGVIAATPLGNTSHFYRWINDWDKNLQSMDKQLIGSIRHIYGSFARTLACSDDYEILFPKDLDVRYKVAVIATCIFIDYRHH